MMSVLIAHRKKAIMIMGRTPLSRTATTVSLFPLPMRTIPGRDDSALSRVLAGHVVWRLGEQRCVSPIDSESMRYWDSQWIHGTRWNRLQGIAVTGNHHWTKTRSTTSWSSNRANYSSSLPSLAESLAVLSHGDPDGSSSPVSSNQTKTKRLQLLPSKQPPCQWQWNIWATLTQASVVATQGSTVVFTTVATQQKQQQDHHQQQQSSTATTTATTPADTATMENVFLTVDYRQRSHGVGMIPSHNAMRRDTGGNMTPTETVAARAVDRALRPLLSSQPSERYVHITSSVQSCPFFYGSSDTDHEHQQQQHLNDGGNGGDPVCMALNSAAAALYAHGYITEPVAATYLSVLENGQVFPQDGWRLPQQRKENKSLRQQKQHHNSNVNVNNHTNGKRERRSRRSDASVDNDSTPSTSDESDYRERSTHTSVIGTLLLAATPQGKVVMMEWTRHGTDHDSDNDGGWGASDDLLTHGSDLEWWPDLLQLALHSLRPVWEQQQQHREQVLQQEQQQQQAETETESARIRDNLGLPPRQDPLLPPNDRQENDRQPSQAAETSLPPNHLLEGVIAYCRQRLGAALYRLFGYDGKEDDIAALRNPQLGIQPNEHGATVQTYIHADPSTILSKGYRGLREKILQEEIYRLVDQYLLEKEPSSNIQNDSSATAIPTARSALHKAAVDCLIRQALAETICRYGSRADQRGTQRNYGWKTIRPVRTIVPALPDTVHGSALFTRGDTQVLCTATLGPPKDGQPWQDPYELARKQQQQQQPWSDGTISTASSYQSLPVGSLRFLRTQEALVSDLNSRKVQAEKERTGLSGTLAEVKRAFLQYDFPSFSTGTVPAATSFTSLNRRAIGHGRLAERAILPILPPARKFPYAIRMTSEVLSSNGSSSMAAVCGTTLALLDAGVPVLAPVAGVSIGWAPHAKAATSTMTTTVTSPTTTTTGTSSSGSPHGLMLDITGTEDFYGAMDFKIAGTYDFVTAAQLDVKEPVSIDTLTQALTLGQAGRRIILDTMEEQMQASHPACGGLKPRIDLKASAPRVEVVRFDPQRKRDLVGPGGVVLRQLEDRYGVFLDLTQEGQCLLFGTNRNMVQKAKSTIMDLVADVVEGEVYSGTVIEVKDFGVIVELLRNKEGLLHVSEMVTPSVALTGSDADEGKESRRRRKGRLGEHREAMDVTRSQPPSPLAFMQVGQTIQVLCIGVDPVQGSINLSQKALSTKDL